MAVDPGRIVATLSALIIPELDGNFAKKLSGDLNKATDSATKNLGSKISGKLGGIGTKLTMGLTAPILGIGTAAVAAGVALDDALDRIRVTTGATGAALEGLTKDFKAVNVKTVQDIGRVSEVFSILAARTKLTGAPLQNLTTQLLFLEEATGAALDPAVFGQFFQAFAFTGDQAAKSLDVLFRASQYSGQGVQDIASTLQSLRPILTQTGMSFEEGASFVASLGKAGIDAESTLMALGRTATKAAKDGKPFNQVFDTTLARINELVAAGKNTDALALAGQLFGPRGATKAIEAAQRGALGIGDAFKAVGQGTDTVQQAVTDTRDFGQQLELFKKQANQSLGELGIKLFPLLEDALNTIIPPLTQLIDKFSSLDSGTQSLILKFAAGAAGLGPLVIGLGKVAGAVSSLTKVAPVAGKAVTGLKAGFTALTAVPPVAWVAILGIAALVAVVFLVIKNWDKIKAAFFAVVDAIKKAWSATVNFLGSMIGKAVDFIKRNWQTIVAILTGPIGIAVLLITKNFDRIKEVASAVVGFVVDSFRNGVSLVTTVWGVVFDIITTPFRLAKDVIGEIINGIIGFFSDLKDAAMNALGPVTDLVGKVGGFVGGGVGKLGNLVGLASGGTAQAGRPYLVGEKGPELIVPKSTSTVIPNHALAGSVAGGFSYNITVVNPAQEPASTSLPTALRRAAQLRG